MSLYRPSFIGLLLSSLFLDAVAAMRQPYCLQYTHIMLKQVEFNSSNPALSNLSKCTKRPAPLGVYPLGVGTPFKGTLGNSIGSNKGYIRAISIFAQAILGLSGHSLTVGTLAWQELHGTSGA